jgi:hypothetical protein
MLCFELYRRIHVAVVKQKAAVCYGDMQLLQMRAKHHRMRGGWLIQVPRLA